MSVQKNLCQFVLYHVGNCVNLCQFGEGFLLMGYEAWREFNLLREKFHLGLELGKV
jgi:hypothetical protein